MNPAYLSLFALLLVAVAAKPSVVSNSANSLNNGNDAPNCTRNEVPSECSGNPACQETCDTLGQPIPCTRSLVANMCYRGCVCKSGFVRVARGDQCIPIDKCEGRVRH